MSEERKFKASHFENIQELIASCIIWIKTDDYDAYCRFFDMGAMEELIKEIEKQQKEIDELRKENIKWKESAEYNYEQYQDIGKSCFDLQEIEKSHKEENGKLRVELEQYKLLEANIDKANKIIAENKFDKGLYGLFIKEKEKNKEYEKQLDLDYVDENYISKDKLKFILSKLNISDVEPWSTYKIDGKILFDLQELL